MALTTCVNVRFSKAIYDELGCPSGYHYGPVWNSWSSDPTNLAVCTNDIIPVDPFSQSDLVNTGLTWCALDLTATTEPPIPAKPVYTEGTCQLKEIVGKFPIINSMECNEYALFIGLISVICAYLFWHQVIK